MLDRTIVLVSIMDLAPDYFINDERISWLEFLGIDDNTTIYDLEDIHGWLEELTDEQRDKMLEKIGEMFIRDIEELADVINDMFYNGERHCVIHRHSF